MNILLTNDDGFTAKGINTLFQILSKEHNVYMIAPDSNRSAVSCHFSFFNDLTLKKEGEKIYSYSGYPTDCVIAGLKSTLLPCKIDLVISGINHGGNLGTDIIYSGTCAGARQGVLLGCPSIALSVDPLEWKEDTYKNMRFDLLSNFVLKNLNKLYELADKVKENHFVNINAKDVDKYEGIAFSKSLCKRNYCDTIELFDQNDGTIRTKLRSDNEEEKIISESDLDIVNRKKVCISLITVEPGSSVLVDDNTFSL